jgi:predicted DNA-binding ribbon-helix-helix protein
MKSAIVKRSIVLGGHKTSVSLENEFWDGLREIADLDKIKVSALLQKIDLDRRTANLSSAIRIFVLNHYQTRPARERPSTQGSRAATTPMATEIAPVR